MDYRDEEWVESMKARLAQAEGLIEKMLTALEGASTYLDGRWVSGQQVKQSIAEAQSFLEGR